MILINPASSVAAQNGAIGQIKPRCPSLFNLEITVSHDSELKESVLAELAWEPSVTAVHIGVTARWPAQPPGQRLAPRPSRTVSLSLN